MTGRFARRGPAVTAADVDAFEARRGLRLPPDYRAFLLEVNGGAFVADDDTDVGAVDPAGPDWYPKHRFFSLHLLGGPVTPDDLRAAQDLALWEDRSTPWPEFLFDLEANLLLWAGDAPGPSALPIAHVGFMPRLLLRLDDVDPGSIWLDAHPEADDPDPDGAPFAGPHVARVADALPAFLGRLAAGDFD